MVTEDHNSIIARLSSEDNIQELKSAWLELENECSESFFTSWAWVGCWVDTVRQSLDLFGFFCREKGVVIGVGLVVSLVGKEGMEIRQHRLGLNDIPRSSAPLNMCIEYNTLLCQPGREKFVWRHFIQALGGMELRWSELYIRALKQSNEVYLPRGVPGAYFRVEGSSPCGKREIAQVDSVESILGGLSSNRRTQLRRAIRRYEQGFGKIKVSEPRDTLQAIRMFGDMGELHTAYWRTRNKSGSFVNKNWKLFHENLINNNFATGEIFLVEVSAGPKNLGYVYGFFWRKQIYMVQTGFSKIEHNWEKPGYISHLYAMVAGAKRGAEVYDFLRGDEPYKRSLSDAAEMVVDVMIRRATISNRLIDLIIETSRTLRATGRRLRRGGQA